MTNSGRKQGAVASNATRSGHVLRALSLLVIVIGWAVSAGSGCAQSEGASCGSDDECLSGQICQSERCSTLCDSNDDCSVGRRCQSGVCTVPSSCQTVDDCRASEICENRLCEVQTPECAADRDCPPGQRCGDGACEPAGVTDVECITRADCDAGESCLDNVCVPLIDAGLPDAGTDASDADTEGVLDAGDTDTPDAVIPDTVLADVPADVSLDAADIADTTPPDVVVPPDVGADTLDVADTPDVPECETIFDCGENETCISGTCVEDILPDECEGREDGVTGETCTAAANCCNGLCLGNPVSGIGSCSAFCDSFDDCNPLGSPYDLFCYNTGPSGRLCAQSDYLDSCGSADACLGGRCLVSNSRRGCSWDCRSSADCPGGEVCGLVAFGTGPLQVCTPIGGRCSVPNDCLSGTCITDDVPALSFCSTFCSPTDPNACPTGYFCDNSLGEFVCLRR
jgi:hypothetical protein